jgi:hypothetical protein
MGGEGIGEGVGWAGEGILGLFGHADRRALIGPKSLYYYLAALVQLHPPKPPPRPAGGSQCLG